MNESICEGCGRPLGDLDPTATECPLCGESID